MALIKCRECGHEVSNKASNCQNCGIALISKTKVLFSLILIGLFFIIILTFLFDDDTSALKEEKKISISQEEIIKQSERKRFIEEELIKKIGIFKKIVVQGKLANIYVTSRFYALDFDEKAKFLDVVFAYYYIQDQTRELLILYDVKSGKEIGTYNKRGLNLN